MPLSLDAAVDSDRLAEPETDGDLHGRQRGLTLLGDG